MGVIAGAVVLAYHLFLEWGLGQKRWGRRDAGASGRITAVPVFMKHNCTMPTSIRFEYAIAGRSLCKGRWTDRFGISRPKHVLRARAGDSCNFSFQYRYWKAGGPCSPLYESSLQSPSRPTLLALISRVRSGTRNIGIGSGGLYSPQHEEAFLFSTYFQGQGLPLQATRCRGPL